MTILSSMADHHTPGKISTLNSFGGMNRKIGETIINQFLAIRQLTPTPGFRPLQFNIHRWNDVGGPATISRNVDD